jgi:sugar/nucleoside kinase (ribokinase family)
LDNLKGARHLHVSADYLRPELSKDCRDIFLSAKKKGISTSLDANWESAQYWEESSFDVLAAVDVFFLNESEAMTISGSDDLTVALELLSSYVNTVVIKRGHSGCIARQDSTSAQVDGLPIVPVDIVGVGSGFNAGFIAKYLMGCSLNICLNFGNLCGAYSTQKSGGIAAFQDQSSFKQFLETYSTEESRVS